MLMGISVDLKELFVNRLLDKRVSNWGLKGLDVKEKGAGLLIKNGREQNHE
jgi:hypothetical protein